ncbi:MAG: guanylate kinase [Abditibacteriota bacterium]|nr:guanylate kinase [Abditibacteriota bacterium]
MDYSKYYKNKGICFVLSGPSGVGKDTVLEYLKSSFSLNKVVTATTRPPREGEIDGVAYDFMTKEDFQQRIKEDYFVEYASYADNFYGTPRKNVEKLINEGKNALLKIEVQGAVNVKKIMPETVLIFLAPPSMEFLEERLRGRGTDSEEDIEKRLKTAKTELEHIKYYDYLIVNEESEKTAEIVKGILTAKTLEINN